MVSVSVPDSRDQPVRRRYADRQREDLRQHRPPTVAAVVFRAGTTGAFSSSADADASPLNGTTVPFFAAGKFGSPASTTATSGSRRASATTLVGSVPVMVRIRKDANALTPGERDRFVAAFAKLNNQGLGRFTDFRDMHKTPPSLAAGARRAGIPAMAPRLSSRSRTRASGDRSERYAALLALRPARAQHLHAGLLRQLRYSRHRQVQSRRTRCSSGRRTVCRGSTAGLSSRLAVAPPNLVQRNGDAWLWATTFEAFRDHGRQSARARRIPASAAPSPGSRDGPEGSAVLSAPLQRRSAVGEMAARRTAASIRRLRLVCQQPHANPLGHKLRTRCGPGTA